MTMDERSPDQVEDMEQIEADVAPGREAGEDEPPTEESAED
jgi:hypothetical protein